MFLMLSSMMTWVSFLRAYFSSRPWYVYQPSKAKPTIITGASAIFGKMWFWVWNWMFVSWFLFNSAQLHDGIHSIDFEFQSADAERQMHIDSSILIKRAPHEARCLTMKIKFWSIVQWFVPTDKKTGNIWTKYNCSRKDSWINIIALRHLICTTTRFFTHSISIFVEPKNYNYSYHTLQEHRALFLINNHQSDHFWTIAERYLAYRYFRTCKQTTITIYSTAVEGIIEIIWLIMNRSCQCN